MELLKLNYRGQPLRLEGSMAGWQELFFNNELVSQKSASPNGTEPTVHEFNVRIKDDESEQLQRCRVLIKVQWQPYEVSYQIYVNDELQEDGKQRDKTIEQQIYPKVPLARRLLRCMSYVTMAVKILKSAQVVQIALASASLMVYSWLFSFSFALILLATLVVHELGHILMLKHLGARPKGIYLIPFVGGLANHESMVTTRWHASLVALAGPVAGLMMSMFYMLLYGTTGSVFFGALASFNALLNLFNLLPVLPLDGGQLLKQISFSMTRYRSLALCLLITALGCVLSFANSLPLLGILMLIGSTEIIIAWKKRYNSDLLSMDSYGQAFTSVCYTVVTLCFIGIIWFFAGMGEDILGLPLKILYS